MLRKNIKEELANITFVERKTLDYKSNANLYKREYLRTHAT